MELRGGEAEVGIRAAPGGHEDNDFSLMKCLLYNTADERPSVKPTSESHSLFPVYFSLVGV